MHKTKFILKQLNAEKYRMHAHWFLWSILAGVLIGLLLLERWITQYNWRKTRKDLSLNSQPAAMLSTPLKADQSSDHLIQWISGGEFITLQSMHNDLILVDLRAGERSFPFPVSSVQVLPATHAELPSILELLPADRVKVFIGVSDLSIMMIAASTCMEKSTPLYLLEDISFHLEVA